MAKKTLKKEGTTKKRKPVNNGKQQKLRTNTQSGTQNKTNSTHNKTNIDILPINQGGSLSAAEPLLETVISPPETPVGVELVSTRTEAEQKIASGEPAGRRELIKSAVLVALGNLGSSVLGLFRQSFVLAPGPQIAAPFYLALSPAQKFNDFLVNGSVQGALIPTFNDYANDREALRRLVFTVVNLVIIIMTIASVGYFFLAPWFMTHFLAAGLVHDEQIRAIQFSQIIFLSLLALGPFAVLQAALYAQKEFGWTAFAATAYHAGIILGAIATTLLGTHLFFGLGPYGLAIGVILGAVGEIILLIPGMRNQHLRYMFVLDLKHPAVRKILMLYAPVAFSFFLSAAFAFLDSSLSTQSPCLSFMTQTKAADCGSLSVTAMQSATFLIQFPGGLVGSALAFAVLPTLTTFIREENIERFKSTLLLGFRLGLLLMIPAMAGLIVLQLPIIKLLYQHGKVTDDQMLLTARALQYYSLQLPFLAIDQLLIAAFYARKNTIFPVIAYMVGAVGYLAVALPFWHTFGVSALTIANSVQNSVHAVFLLIVLWRVVGSLHLRSLLPALSKILIATAVLVVVAWGLQWFFAQSHLHIFSLDWFVGRLLIVVIAGGLATVAYFVMAMVLKIEEIALLKGAVLAKLGKR